jgi:hypothetical protein
MNLDLANMVQHKPGFRRRLAARPIEEKLALLDALRERALAIRPVRHACLICPCDRPCAGTIR